MAETMLSVKDNKYKSEELQTVNIIKKEWSRLTAIHTSAFSKDPAVIVMFSKAQHEEAVREMLTSSSTDARCILAAAEPIKRRGERLGWIGCRLEGYEDHEMMSNSSGRHNVATPQHNNREDDVKKEEGTDDDRPDVKRGPGHESNLPKKDARKTKGTVYRKNAIQEDLKRAPLEERGWKKAAIQGPTTTQTGADRIDALESGKGGMEGRGDRDAMGRRYSMVISDEMTRVLKDNYQEAKSEHTGETVPVKVKEGGMGAPPKHRTPQPDNNDTNDTNMKPSRLASAIQDNAVSMQKQHMGDRKFIYINTLVVAPASQGKGVGTVLLKWIIARADRDGVPIWVQSSPTARDAYAKVGFVDVDHWDVNLAGFTGRADGYNGWGPYRFFYMRRTPEVEVEAEKTGTDQA